MAAQAGWYADPAGGHQYRYWDGAAWTEHVADDGRQAIDPLPAADPLAALRAREAEVRAELAEVEDKIRRAAESQDDSHLGNMLIASVEARLSGAEASASSPLTRQAALREELDSIERQLAEAGGTIPRQLP